ncbi:hypothetical protein TIFTF001_023216 [Ficus carica]|uniref:Uncharacterized protein n=1 Tax=Ficus carica TaxID=3494 RepID=A0AA88ALF5_FICCA|nr:hypothetical protein TIFTF001_023216 [Ficus carica]
MEVEISIRLNRIPLTRLDPTRIFFPGNHVTRPEFTTLPSLSQHSIHHLTSDVKPVTAHINGQLPSPATAHITSSTSATCLDWGYAYWCWRQLTLVSLNRTRDAWRRFIGPIAPMRLRPICSPGTLWSRPDRITRMPDSLTDLSIRVHVADTHRCPNHFECKPTQTEILTENVKNLTEIVRVLMDTHRETHNAQLPQVQPEAAESTLTKPPGSTGQPRSLSPEADGRSNRTNRESLRHQLREEELNSGRECSRSRNQVTRSRTVMSQATTRYDPDRLRRETVNVRGSTTFVFDRLGRPGTSRHWIRDHSIDKSAKEENDNQNRLDHL